MPSLIGAVVLRASGGVLAALRDGVHAVDLATGMCALVVAPEPADLGHRLNDTKPDRRGVLWTSTMRDYGLTPTGALYRVAADLVPRSMIDDVRVPNALCWSPDDGTLYFADTRDGRLRAYAHDPHHGTLGPMRVLV